MVLAEPTGWIARAEAYCRLGFPLVPLHAVDAGGRCSCGDAGCAAPGDHPRAEPWADEVVRQPHGIRPWADLWESDGEIGLALGPATGLAALVVEPGGERALDGLAGTRYRIVPGPRFIDRATGEAYYLFAHPYVGPPARLDLGPGLHALLGPTALRLPPGATGGGAAFRQWTSPPTQRRPPPFPRWLLRAGGVVLPGVDRPSEPIERTLSLVPAAVLVESEAPRNVWCAYPWVRRGALTVLAGTSKTAGKTQFLLHLAAAAAGHRGFLGEELIGGARTAFVSEQPLDSLRFTVEEAGLRSRADVQNLYLLSGAGLDRAGWRLFMDDLARTCREQRIGLVVLDSLDGLAGPGADPADVVEGLLALAASGAGVVASTSAALNDGLAAAVPALGRLAPAADILVGLRCPPGARPNVRVVEALSRDGCAPRSLHVEWRRDAYHVLDREGRHGPLFDGARIAADRELHVGDGLGNGGGQVDGFGRLPTLTGVVAADLLGSPGGEA